MLVLKYYFVAVQKVALQSLAEENKKKMKMKQKLEKNMKQDMYFMYFFSCIVESGLKYP